MTPLTQEFHKEIADGRGIRIQQVDFDDLAGVMATIVDTYPSNRMTQAIKASLERWASGPSI
jgi:hypothetical protein